MWIQPLWLKTQSVEHHGLAANDCCFIWKPPAAIRFYQLKSNYDTDVFFFLQMSKSRRVIIIIKMHCYHLHSIKHTSIDLYFRGKKTLANQQERRNFNLHYTMSYGSKTIWYIYMSGSKKKKKSEVWGIILIFGNSIV